MNPSSRFVIRSLLCLGAALAHALPGQAALILTNPNQFSGTETVLTFEGVIPSVSVPSYGGVEFQLVGGAPGRGPLGFLFGSAPREFGPQEASGVNTINEPGGQPALDVQMTFPGPIHRLAFEFFRGDTPADPILLTLFSAGQALETIAFPVRGPGVFYFYGVESDVAFDQAVLRGPGFTRQVFLDNVRFESTGDSIVPEPAALTLFGLALLTTIGYYGRSRT